MSFISNLFGKNQVHAHRFRGQGYSEEEALHQAEQRYLAWKRDLDNEDKRVEVLTKETKYVRKSQLLYLCYIDCTFKNIKS